LMYACTQVLLDYLGFPTVANQSPAVSYQVILLLLHWKQVGSLPELPPLVCPSYNPAKPQRQMSTVSSKEMRKEKGRPGTFQQCLPQKWKLMTTDSMVYSKP
jgi:hypothetical protein